MDKILKFLKCDHSNESYVLSPTFLWYCSLCCSRWLQLLSLGMNSSSVNMCESLIKFSENVTIHDISIEKYWVVLYKMVLYSWLCGWNGLELSVYDHSNENHWADFPVILLFMLYKVVLTWVCENPLLRWFPSKRNTQFCLDRRTRAKTATLDDPDNYMKTRLTKKSLDSAIP